VEKHYVVNDGKSRGKTRSVRGAGLEFSWRTEASGGRVESVETGTPRNALATNRNRANVLRARSESWLRHNRGNPFTTYPFVSMPKLGGKTSTVDFSQLASYFF
jgi:hypothetical protein